MVAGNHVLALLLRTITGVPLSRGAGCLVCTFGSLFLWFLRLMFVWSLRIIDLPQVTDR